MRSSLFAVAASLATASAAVQGFNYGATKTDGSFMFEADYKEKFSAAKSLPGASGFSSARLYTMIQGGSSTNEPTQAIPAAIAEDTTLLLGLWASGGQDFFNAEITALQSAITQYGDDFTSRVVGISVGSEDLYRISPTGIAALSGYGANPDVLVSYIGQLRKALASTALSGAVIGHVDTWTAWANSSNSAVAAACDWVGMDAYPYFQNSEDNRIATGKSLFNSALSATKNAAGGKPVWVTETGWPVSGKTENLAVPNADNAKTYWQEVGCPLFDNVNTWWFTLQDSDPTTPNPSFGIVDTNLKPFFDLSCDDITPASSTVATSATSAQASASSVASTLATSSIVLTGATSNSASPATSTDAGSNEVSSVASSASSATETLVSSGGGLSPSHGGGGGVIVSTTASGAVSSETGSTGSNGTVNTPTSSPTTSVTSTPPSGASIRSISAAAAIGALIIAFVAL